MCGSLLFLFFFFSSRRRHTRCSRDWSSDVCSSDLATGGTATLNAADADLVVQLAPTRRTSTFEYVRRLRATLPSEFPGVTFFFLPADIVNQVLNLGLPAPIDVQIVGQDKMADYGVA